MRYRTIVADPPWEIARTMGSGGRRKNATVVPYRMMGLDAIKAIDVESVAADDCALFLWSTRRLFREGETASVARSWGFEPIGEMIWGLPNPGLGSRSFSNDHEPILVAGRGTHGIISNDGSLGVWFWRQVYEYGPAGVPQKVHSAKPPGFLELVEAITEGPRLELFARENRLGWDSWGDEALDHLGLALT